jgi:hypothetical protein
VSDAIIERGSLDSGKNTEPGEHSIKNKKDWRKDLTCPQFENSTGRSLRSPWGAFSLGETPPLLYPSILVTKASTKPPKVGWKALAVGKLVDRVDPVT